MTDTATKQPHTEEQPGKPPAHPGEDEATKDKQTDGDEEEDETK